MVFVALVCATPNSPFYPLLPIGMQAADPLRWISGVIGLGHLGTTPLMIVGLLAVTSAAAGFVLLAIGFHAIVLMLPSFFSRDVYSHAYYGRIVSTYGGNPYVLTPTDFPLNGLWHLTWAGWRETPSVYGPLFTWMSALMTRIVKDPSEVVASFQLLAAL